MTLGQEPSAMPHRRPLLAAVLLALAAPAAARAHGDVAPQPVDVSALPALNGELHSTNPYRDTPAYAEAVKVGERAYNQNCARCHGLGAVSGGISPDLRMLVPGDDDEYYLGRVMSGSVRNGVTYMPAFAEIFGQEAIWSIRSWLDTVAEQ